MEASNGTHDHRRWEEPTVATAKRAKQFVEEAEQWAPSWLTTDLIFDLARRAVLDGGTD